MNRRLPALLLGTVVALPACGHRGDPLPPLRKTPPAPTEFRVAQRGAEIELSAVAPAASIDGVRYQNLTLEFLYTTGQGDLDKTGARLDVRALPGARGAVTVPLPSPGTSLRAAARAVAGGDKGAKTVASTLLAHPQVEAPSGLVASLGGDGVTLAWHGPKPEPLPSPPPSPAPGRAHAGGPTPSPDAAASAAQRQGAPPAAPAATSSAGGPAATAAGATAPAGGTGQPSPAGEPAASAANTPRPNGFLVYRRVGNAGYSNPLEAEPRDQRRFTDGDAPLGASVCYVARAAASTKPLVESAPSNEACLETRDVSAPAAPDGLVVIPREGALQLLWTPSREEDLAGYRVYRAESPAPPTRLAELAATEASYVDRTAERGRRYAYTLTAFDRAGNESPPSESVEAAVP